MLSNKNTPLIRQLAFFLASFSDFLPASTGEFLLIGKIGDEQMRPICQQSAALALRGCLDSYALKLPHVLPVAIHRSRSFAYSFEYSIKYLHSFIYLGTTVAFRTIPITGY